jgi:CubicO group peptidase (beta-lactamase class C family)
LTIPSRTPFRSLSFAIALSLTVATTAALPAQVASSLESDTRATQQPDTAALARDIPGIMEVAHVPGLSMAVVQSGRVSWTGAFGTFGDSAHTRVDTETVFEAASLSKPVFAYLVLRMADRGEFDLDRPLHEMLGYPRLAHDDRYRRITARMVLTHGTGLPNWGGEQLTLEFDPGTSLGYSGEGFVYLQKVIEHVTDQPIDELARHEVFEPLGMTRSSFQWKERFAGNSAYARDWLWRVEPIKQYVEANVAGSLVTTAADYARFVAAVLNGTGLSREIWAAFLAPERQGNPGTYFGLGIGVAEGPSAPVFFHGGNNDARFTSFMFGDIETGHGFVYLTNSNEGTTLVEAMIERVMGEAPGLGDVRHDDPRQIASLSVQRAAVERGADAAREEFRKTRADENSRLSPDQAMGLAEILAQLGFAPLAIEVLATATGDFPGSSRLHRARGDALQSAGEHRAAIESYRLALALEPDDEDVPRRIRWIEDRLTAETNPVHVPRSTLESYAGQYDVRRVTLREGRLYYQRDGNPEHQLIPLSQDLFALSGSRTIRLRFVGNGVRPASKIIGIYSDGRTDESVRSRGD